MVRDKSATVTVPPDGGWGWIVLGAALVVNLLIPGTVKSFGVLFVEFLQVFKATSTAASWMPALCYFLYNSLGPLSSVLSARYSYRTVTLIGGAFAAGGMMISYFASSVTYLYVSYGLMVGIGAGLSFPPTVYIVTAYFKRLRGFANGLCISGSAIGTIILPPFLQYLLDCFGYRGAVLIMGALTLNTLVCGLLYHPVEQHMKEVPATVEDGIDNEALSLDESEKQNSLCITEGFTLEFETSDKREVTLPIEDVLSTVKVDETLKLEGKISSADGTLKKDRKNSVVEAYRQISEDELESGVFARGSNAVVAANEIPAEKNEPNEGTKPAASTASCKDSPKEKVSNNVEKKDESSTCVKKPFFDLSLLRDPLYLIILISHSTSAISNTNFMILLPSYAISQGIDKNSSALLLSIVSALDLVGRIGGASLSDIDFVPKYYYYVGGLGTSGIALALLPMANGYASLSFFCALFGLSSGMYIGITTVIMADMLGTEKLSSSYGISLFVNGVLQLVGPPICGVVYENVGSYKPIFLALGIVLILGTALWALLPLIKKANKKSVKDA